MKLLEMRSSKIPPFSQIYEIRVHEEMDDDLAAWFDPLTIVHEPNGTTFTVPVRDQAELHGLLIKIRDLNLTLVAVINK